MFIGLITTNSHAFSSARYSVTQSRDGGQTRFVVVLQLSLTCFDIPFQRVKKSIARFRCRFAWGVKGEEEKKTTGKKRKEREKGLEKETKIASKTDLLREERQLLLGNRETRNKG